MTTTTTMSKIKDSPELVEISLSKPQDSSFHTPNSIITHPKFIFTDIEMNSLLSLTYTSLKDILPPNRSPSAIMSSTNNSIWHEIPIKNPLVKQAALSYLQPMSTPQVSDDRGVFSKLKDKFCCGGGGTGRFGCYEFIREFVRIIKHAFRERRGENDDYDYDYDYDSDDDYDDDEEEDDRVD